MSFSNGDIVFAAASQEVRIISRVSERDIVSFLWILAQKSVSFFELLPSELQENNSKKITK